MDADARTNVPVFDVAGVKRRLMHDDALMLMVLQVFMQEMPKQIEQLKAAHAAADMAGVKLQAHSIKGACGNVGATAMQALALEVEITAETCNRNRLAGLMDEIDAAQHAVYIAMQEIAEA
jgi:HPt (histidine-containing phosphotransfer) domain-containing protein